MYAFFFLFVVDHVYSWNVRIVDMLTSVYSWREGSLEARGWEHPGGSKITDPSPRGHVFSPHLSHHVLCHLFQLPSSVLLGLRILVNGALFDGSTSQFLVAPCLSMWSLPPAVITSAPPHLCQQFRQSLRLHHPHLTFQQLFAMHK